MSDVPRREPAVTVVTVCWNALADLQLTAASMQQQVYTGLHHVVIDGGSTDGTDAWLLQHRQQFAVAVSERDGGIYDAMNKAIELCPPCEWVIFMNAGDTFHAPDVLDKSLEQLTREDVDFIFGGVSIRGDSAVDAPRTYKARRNVSAEMPGCHQSCFVRAETMRRLRFDLSYKVAGDFECWLRGTHRHSAKTAFLDHVIATIAPEGYSARNETTLQREYTRALRSHVGRTAAALWLARRKLRRLALELRDQLRGRRA